MKIFVVAGGLNYEGYYPPEAAFLSEEKANEYAAEVKVPKHYDYVDVFPIEIPEEEHTWEIG